MCDTMVALGNSTKDGSVIFAKNSDRQPNEPLVMIRNPRKQFKKASKVRCTYIKIPQVEETYEVFLIKPSWIWGCEMGCNEFGLNVGNEAVFTREKYGRDSLLGMDLVRLALERCRTSDEALDMITGLLEKYGQGGNCGYEKKFAYHNSFLIADKTSAWVLETAGSFWAAERVKDIRSISNCLTIGNKFDRSHPGLVENAVRKGWCRGEDDFHFAKCYGNRLITKLSGSRQRMETSTSILEKEKGNITALTMKQILRNHEKGFEGKQFQGHSLKSICMHGGFLYGDHTTGSFIAVLNPQKNSYLVTGASTPCLSVFKPFWMVNGERLSFKEEEKDAALKFWRKREKLHRCVLENRIPGLESYLAERNRLEEDFEEMSSSLDLSGVGEQELAKIINSALEAEENLIDRTLATALDQPGKIKGNFYFRYYWKKQNATLTNEGSNQASGKGSSQASG